ncbi:MAG: TldD/PmbA family protein [Polyangiaceae bacterium]|nr:TldD/PmbA family protein [Polyangiaceae bacterium]
MITRRALLIRGSLATLSAACGAANLPEGQKERPPPDARPIPDELLADILGRALDEAKALGATYADARVHRRRHEKVATREDHVVEVASSETYGIGVRVLAFGAWGFASTGLVTDDAAKDAAKRAVQVAKANAGAQIRKIELAPVSQYTDVYKTPLETDPFDVSLAEKAALLLSFWPEAKKVAGVSFLEASCEAFDEHKVFASSEGSVIEQRIVRVGAGYEITARDDKQGEFVTRAHELPPMQSGWEHVTGSSLATDVRKMADDAVKKLKAPSVNPGKRDLILAPSNLWLTIHESVGHPTELDRALGYEANLAGTSFATVDQTGKLVYGAPIVTLYADKTTPGGLASCAYDDDGVRTQKWDLVTKGRFVGWQTTRDQAAWIGEKASRGTSYAEDHRSLPFQRMPNVSLQPGAEAHDIDDLVAATDDGILITGDGSWSIDQQRYNFQFGGQMFYEVKGGKITGAVRDVAYQSNTLDFWRSCDLLGGPESFELHGSLYDGKGEPVQSNAVSHGCPPARFRGVNILRTRDRA